MKVISHRGCIVGVDKELENNPIHIEKYAKLYPNLAFEVDLWGYVVCLGTLNYSSEHFGGALYLGHDVPKYRITYEFLKKYQDRLYIHIKSAETVKALSIECEKNGEGVKNFNLFYHENDKVTYTSQGEMWTGHYEYLTTTSIFLSPELFGHKFEKIHPHIVNGLRGICTKYPMEYEEYL